MRLNKKALKLGLGFICLALTISQWGCGDKSNSTSSSSTQPPLRLPLPRDEDELTFPEPPHPLSESLNLTRNSIAGKWDIAEILTQENDSSMQFLQNLTIRGSLVLGVTEDKRVLLKWSHYNFAQPCRFSILYSVEYCCQTMRNATFTAKPNSIKVSPEGCTSALFQKSPEEVVQVLEPVIERTYHFTYFSDHLELTFPYDNPTTNIHLRPIHH